MNVVPLLVQIGLKKTKQGDIQHDYPDWTALDAELGGDHTAHQIVKWRYDRTSGHQDETPGSPRGIWFGLLLVTQEFANAALRQFPSKVRILAESELEDFWDNKAHCHLPDKDRDIGELQSLAAELQLKKELGQDTASLLSEITEALDENSTRPGVRKNNQRRWVDFKAAQGLTVVGLG